MTFDEFVQTTQNLCIDLTKTLRGNDDIAPAFIVVNDKGIHLAPLDLMPGIDLNNDKSKDILGDVIMPMIIEKLQGKMTAFVSSAWMLQINNDDKNALARAKEFGSPGKHPDRIEVVNIQVLSADPHKVAICWAEIERHPDDTVTLKPFETKIMDVTPQSNVQGRLTDGAMKKLLEVAGKSTSEFELEELED